MGFGPICITMDDIIGISWEAVTHEVEVDFNRVNLQDYEEDGTLCGEVHFILYKGNHYHLTIRTDDGDDIYVDTDDVWDNGDRVGIRIAPSYIRLYKKCSELE